MFLEKNEDSINREGFDVLEDYVNGYADYLKSKALKSLVESMEETITNCITEVRAELQEKKEYHIGHICGHFFNDETFFKIKLEHILEPQLKDKYPEEDYFYPETIMAVTDRFLEKIKNLNKHPKVKQFFIDLFEEIIKEGDKS